MKTITALLLLLSFNIQAHPGVGIVEDSKGNIFYTDLTQVLKISSDGKKSVVVRNVHTHELFMDENDNLFGEHLWYNGENSNTWGHYVWRFSANGEFKKIIPDTSGFLENYSFVRDHFGRMYWANRSGDCQKITRKNSNGSVTQLGDECLKNIRFMSSTEDGVIFVMDFQDLRRIDNNGKVKTIASRIFDKNISQSTIANQNSVMGVWNDEEGNIYTAVTAAGVVKKFRIAGKEEIIYRSSTPWFPTGGMVDSKNNLWVLEGTGQNEVRVQKVPARQLRIE